MTASESCGERSSTPAFVPADAGAGEDPVCHFLGRSGGFFPRKEVFLHNRWLVCAAGCSGKEEFVSMHGGREENAKGDIRGAGESRYIFGGGTGNKIFLDLEKN